MTLDWTFALGGLYPVCRPSLGIPLATQWCPPSNQRSQGPKNQNTNRKSRHGLYMDSVKSTPRVPGATTDPTEAFMQEVPLFLQTDSTGSRGRPQLGPLPARPGSLEQRTPHTKTPPPRGPDLNKPPIILGANHFPVL